MMMNLYIRPIRKQDIESIVELSLLAWEPVFRSFEQILSPTIYTTLYPNWRIIQKEGIEAICKDTAKYIVWVAEADGIVVGFIAYELNTKDKVGEVDLLAVHPAYQNRGIGTELNNFALTKMQEGGMKLASSPQAAILGMLLPEHRMRRLDILPCHWFGITKIYRPIQVP